MTESPRKKSLARTTEKLLALALLGCAAALLLFALRLQLGNSRSLVDFMGFYTAATVVKQGTWSELYDTEIQLSQQQRIFGHREPTLVFIHPPFEALVLFPFAYMSYKAAYLSWNLVSLLVLICSLYLLRSSATHFGTASRLILAASMFYPVISTLREGQDSILLLLPYVGALAGLKNNRDFRAGCALGAGLFRFQLVLPFLLVFLMRRRWRFILNLSQFGRGGRCAQS